MVPSLGKMKLLCVVLAFQALVVLQVHCAGKKAASSEPKVTSQVRVWSYDHQPCCMRAKEPCCTCAGLLRYRD